MQKCESKLWLYKFLREIFHDKMRTYSFLCNFCGSPFEVSRWDAKTCSKIHRTRLARMQRFSSEEKNLYCIICGKRYKQNIGSDNMAVPEISAVWCSDSCHEILNDMKIYGMTDETKKRIKAIISNLNAEDVGKVIGKIFKRRKK